MSIKNVLVIVSAAEEDNACLRMAFAIAEQHQAKVAALYVKPVVAVYSDGMGFDMTPSIIEAQQTYLDAAAKKAEDATKAQAAKEHCPIEWRCEEGDEQLVAASHAHYADLVLATPDTARDLMFVAGVPVIAVPAQAPSQSPKSILVAWNGSRESARAVRDAMDFLSAADQVTVAVIDPPAGSQIGEDIAALIASHGGKVDVREMLSGGQNIGSLLLKEAKANGVSMIVMGGYGHSRFREWVLGGVTDQILSDSGLPVMLSH